MTARAEVLTGHTHTVGRSGYCVTCGAPCTPALQRMALSLFRPGSDFTAWPKGGDSALWTTSEKHKPGEWIIRAFVRPIRSTFHGHHWTPAIPKQTAAEVAAYLRNIGVVAIGALIAQQEYRTGPHPKSYRMPDGTFAPLYRSKSITLKGQTHITFTTGDTKCSR